LERKRRRSSPAAAATKTSEPLVATEQLLELYGRMVVVRRLEEALGQAHAAGHFRGPLHRCDGQEAVGVGVTSALHPGDTVTSTHRGHAHFVGAGVDLNRMVAEIFGKATGLCKGRAGHQLIADAGRGLLGGNSIVGGTIPIAVGMALAHRTLAPGRIAVCIFGDGTVNAGTFGEGLNMAALWRLPVVFVCENNQFGLTVHLTRHMAHTRIADRAVGFGIPAEEVDGNDVEAVAAVARRAFASARAGGGPRLLVAQTYRQQGFSTTDLGGYRDERERDRWPDPLDVTRARLLARGVDRTTLERVEEDGRAAVAAAIAYAMESPYPDATDVTARARR
jgi:TPP-dependent pyruvate/acetoin dehydrogenase alpha subunit